MQAEISCEQYVRLSAIARNVDPKSSRQYFRSMMIERKNNQLFIVVCDSFLLVVERVGMNEGPDEQTNIVVDDALVKQCQIESAFDGKLLIIVTPALGFTALKTTMGYNHPGNGMVALPAENYFSTWRTILPNDTPKKSVGAMHWNAQNVALLAQSSPSGAVRFPAHIDVKKPVVLNDANYDYWLGLFIANSNNEDTTEPATIPEWIR